MGATEDACDLMQPKPYPVAPSDDLLYSLWEAPSSENDVIMHMMKFFKATGSHVIDHGG